MTQPTLDEITVILMNFRKESSDEIYRLHGFVDALAQAHLAIAQLIEQIIGETVGEDYIERLTDENIVGNGKSEIDRYALCASRAMGYNQAINNIRLRAKALGVEL